ncbi:AAA family ATPase [Oxalobacter formigenes]|uniref:ATP-binding protein n=1 Tax=Oxalobacter formigenes OXCC13 TaxID=556269 RepID=C3X7U6_OXAFO|nr:AAA family ATPase [Oxalobacter formigenes]ARQ46712.1 hypothetical protein BRW83_1973 [Oxalobacter formigenes]ARQ78779.1 ATP-binding protein [Oxalobacter formigenes OXCC13]EEO29272.1 hypothetical protein OFBG_00300 [Oxalobacter formigenes OXCC13]MCZ4062620.1 ATP-binding protein [Oxalobacter formigenes]QDX32645.1 AAA family ATPase [Oxalobacter formigenes]
MSISTIILGESGTGKTTSLRNLNPDEVALIQVIKKPLPFRSAGWMPYVTDSWEKIIKGMNLAVEKGRKIIVIDDFQYVMANEFMRRSQERGFDKFTEIGNHAWEIFNVAGTLPDDVRVYLLSHTQESDNGTVKLKTIGKMLDEKITPEGMFTIVLRTVVSDGQHFFRTRNSGNDTVKSPIGLFETDIIDNDLAFVDKEICNYYSIGNQS